MRFFLILMMSCKILASTIPGYNTFYKFGVNSANILRSDTIGNSIFMWVQQEDEAGYADFRFVTSFANGQFSNDAIFGSVQDPFAYNVCYDNSLSCLMFYSSGNTLYYSYGDPRLSTFSQNKQTYTVAGATAIFYSQLRYCSAVNAFYIVLVANNGIFLLKYNGSAFTAVKVVNDTALLNASFNSDTEGNLLIAYNKNLSNSESNQISFYTVYVTKELVFSAPTQIFNSPTTARAYMAVYQTNLNDPNYWGVIKKNEITFLSKNGSLASPSEYQFYGPNTIFVSQAPGRIIGFRNRFLERELEVGFYDLTNLSSQTIFPESQTSILGQKIQGQFYSLFSLKNSNLFLTTIGYDQKVSSFYLPLDSQSFERISSFSSPYSIDSTFIAGFLYPYRGARITWFSIDSSLGFYDEVGLLYRFGRFSPIKYQRGSNW